MLFAFVYVSWTMFENTCYIKSTIFFYSATPNFIYLYFFIIIIIIIKTVLIQLKVKHHLNIALLTNDFQYQDVEKNLNVMLNVFFQRTILMLIKIS